MTDDDRVELDGGKTAAEWVDELTAETAEPFQEVTRVVFTAVLEGHERAYEVAREFRERREAA